MVAASTMLQLWLPSVPESNCCFVHLPHPLWSLLRQSSPLRLHSKQTSGIRRNTNLFRRFRAETTHCSGHFLLTHPLQGSPIVAASHLVLRARQGTHAFVDVTSGMTPETDFPRVNGVRPKDLAVFSIRAMLYSSLSVRHFRSLRARRFASFSAGLIDNMGRGFGDSGDFYRQL